MDKAGLKHDAVWSVKKNKLNESPISLAQVPRFPFGGNE